MDADRAAFSDIRKQPELRPLKRFLRMKTCMGKGSHDPYLLSLVVVRPRWVLPAPSAAA